jgi:hypothetical protein
VTTTTVLAFDIENDGDMDLYAANSRVPNELYVNQGNGVFSRENRGADDVVETGVPHCPLLLRISIKMVLPTFIWSNERVQIGCMLTRETGPLSIRLRLPALI